MPLRHLCIKKENTYLARYHFTGWLLQMRSNYVQLLYVRFHTEAYLKLNTKSVLKSI